MLPRFLSVIVTGRVRKPMDSYQPHTSLKRQSLSQPTAASSLYTREPLAAVRPLMILIKRSFRCITNFETLPPLISQYCRFRRAANIASFPPGEAKGW